MFLTRTLTAVVLLAAFLAALLLLDRNLFAILVAVAVALGGREWGLLTGMSGWHAAAFAAACVVLYGVLLGSATIEPVLWVGAAFWVVAVPWWLASGVKSNQRALLRAAGVAALVPAGLAMATLAPRYLLMALGVVWIADIAAYIVGSAIGRHKLAPSISPGKSWEGVAGGAVGVLIYAIICAMFEPAFATRIHGAAWATYLAGAMFLCAASVLGDLFESALKRQAGAKDSGRLLPGHGGVLDRIDSATAVLPLALLLTQAMGAT